MADPVVVLNDRLQRYAEQVYSQRCAAIARLGIHREAWCKKPDLLGVQGEIAFATISGIRRLNFTAPATREEYEAQTQVGDVGVWEVKSSRHISAVLALTAAWTRTHHPQRPYVLMVEEAPLRWIARGWTWGHVLLRAENLKQVGEHPVARVRACYVAPTLMPYMRGYSDPQALEDRLTWAAMENAL